jgi:alcohol dehydrogenase class IV
MTASGEPAARFDLAVPTDVRFGAGRIREVPQALIDLGARQVLVVTGRQTSRAEPLRAALSEQGVSSSVFPVAGEPTIELLRAGLTTLADRNCDAVLGFGGGSALDVAKAVAVLSTPAADPLDHLEVIGAGRPITRPGLPCVAVPTTAGTGSEVTRNAVLSDGRIKASLRTPLMLPKVALVDPDLLAGLPRATIAASGMDALSQVLEPLVSQRANPFSDALARDGIRRSARSLLRGWTDGMADPSVREDLALASLFGGLCLANSGLGAVHGIAAAAGARLDAPHGAVCAAVLAAAVELNLRALTERAPDHPALRRFAEVARLLTDDPAARAQDAVGWLRALTTSLEIPGLSQYGLDEEEIAPLARDSLKASSMRGNPIELTEAEVSEILRRSS